MVDTVKAMLESDFGFNMDGYLRNRVTYDSIDIVSESVRQLTGFTPQKVAVLSDGNKIYIEFAGNLERLMEDSGCDLREALDMVMTHNKLGAHEPYLIIDETCVNKLDMDAVIKTVGADHIFRK